MDISEEEKKRRRAAFVIEGGFTEDEALLINELAEHAAHEAMVAVDRVVDTAPDARHAQVTHAITLKILAVNCKLALNLMAFEALIAEEYARGTAN